MTHIRSNNIYISPQLHRWLKWLAEMETGQEQNVLSEAFRATQDSVAEKIMREYILEKYPTIQELEADYWTARIKLDSETVNKLKEQTAKTNERVAE